MRQKLRESIDFREFARAIGEIVRFGEGEIIFRENDVPACMYIVLAGSIELTAHDKVIETIQANKALGIVSLLDGLPRTATARVKEPCELAMMDEKHFRYMVEEVPHFGWYVMRELAQRLRATNAEESDYQLT